METTKSRVRGVRTMSILATVYEAAKAVVVAAGLTLEIVSRHTHTATVWDATEWSWRKEKYETLVVQPCVPRSADGSIPYVLALYDDGVVTSFDPTFDWTEEKVNALDLSHCDVCGARRARKRMFIVEHEGQVKQVGGVCIKKLDLELAARNMIKEFERVLSKAAGTLDPEDCIDRGGRWHGFTAGELEMFLTLCGYHAATGRFVTKGEAYRSDRVATAGYAENLIYSDLHSTKEKVRKAAQEELEAAYRHSARPANGWREECEKWLADQKWSDFIQNARAAFEKPLWKRAGLLAAVPMCIARNAQRAAEKAQATKLTPVPQTTGRHEFGECTVVRTKWIEGIYGRTLIVTLATKDGHGLVCFYNGRDDDMVDTPGNVVEVKATVSGLDKYSGLTRVKRPKFKGIKVAAWSDDENEANA